MSWLGSHLLISRQSCHAAADWLKNRLVSPDWSTYRWFACDLIITIGKYLANYATMTSHNIGDHKSF